MMFIDLTLPRPAENLACDEALLDESEAEADLEILRLWEPADEFVVLGYGNHVDTEVNRAACAARGIPIFRRCSGGGTVLQGPGCLNYSVILRIDDGGPLHSITTANRFIMERNRAAIESLLVGPTGPARRVEVSGHTDLSINGLKFAGNAQRRRKRFLLFHGTLLLNLDLAFIETVLPMPSRQPDYRRNRRHRDFLTNLHLPLPAVKSALQQAWSADKPLETIPRERIASLVRDKYETAEWNLKF
jgi:lipoate-protein ligase A